jgi:hypothetical protein
MKRNLALFACSATAASLFLGCSLSEPAPGTSTPTLGTTAHLTILQTSDLHSHANGEGPMSATATASTPGSQGSYARIAAYVGAVRSAADADHPVVLVDSGDWTMGSLYDLTLGSSPLQLANMVALGYDCTTLGNHEFDYTPKGLATMLKAAKATSLGFNVPIVASNMNLNGDSDLSGFMGTAILPSYTETLSNGLKVGFIGLMGEDASADAPNSYPVSFTPLSQDYATIQALVTKLRGEGCNVVVALDHVGTDATTGGYTGEDISLAQNVSGIDVIASGHTHNAFANATASHPVAFAAGSTPWTTQVISCGCYGEYVSRIDLTWSASTQSTTLDTTVTPNGASNLPMTDATLATCGVKAEPAFTGFTLAADEGLNLNLGPLFTTFFPTTYKAGDLSTGVYATVGATDQDMIPNDANAVICPNGLGNLCADADRNVPNGIIAKVLLANGWTGSMTDPNLPAIMAALAGAGFDPTPYTAAVCPTGVIRDRLLTSGGQPTPISLSNLYDVLPLGITPDTTQALPVCYPMMWAYLTGQDLRTLCALQLVGQTNMISNSDYLNISGLTCTLDSTNLGTFYAFMTAAAVLKETDQKALAGSANAAAAITAVGDMGSDGGASLLALAEGGNVYAVAMATLNGTQANPAVNFPIVGEVAALSAADAKGGTSTLNALLVEDASAAITGISAFASSDPACTATTGLTPLALDTTRYRISANLYGVLMLDAIQSQFGVSISPYASATGSTVLSQSDMTTLLGNRINAVPGGTSLVELKEWEALLEYLTAPAASGGLAGEIGPAYASTVNIADYASFGAAVTTRAGSGYAQGVLPATVQLMTTLQNLAAAK